ncbi:hypothetical protein GCM10009858_30750 [Terrabacter carboxydivorans]|uniref:Uncharacterized protein n=1 Tax=Terrabacter carboxydivorans TaxID=619730 RepID=A0ABN3LUV7_9MICO
MAISLIAAPAVAIAGAPSALAGPTPTTHAISTTTNPDVDGTGHCKNGNEAVNCNIYDGKEFVWLTGLPANAGLDSGSYFFAVLVPGGQANPNDGGANNLSDDYDAYTNRTFSIADNGAISYTGSHDIANNKIRLMPYADTTNPGGVYILAVCSLANGYPVDPSTCKYDAFKVGESANAEAPTITKTADGAYTNSYTWAITKDVDKTLVQGGGSTATFNYTVGVTHDGGTVSDVGVTGIITVFNPNTSSVHIDDVTDVLSDGTVCTVTGAGPQDIPAGDTDFAYTCQLAGLPQGALDNTAEVAWSNQSVGSAFLPGDTAGFTFTRVAFTGTQVDECASVSDSYAGTLGTVCVGDPNPTTFTYSRTVPVPVDTCVSYDNTATFTTNDTGTTGSASQTVTVCGKDYGLTMGFWQNKNGQAIITGGASTASVCNSATWLRQFAPFQDLSATATCAKVGTYVTNVIKAANASGASMNAMLKAQMLATALDVYFSDAALGGNKISSPLPLGGVKIDLTKVCSVLSLSGSCTGSMISTSSAFGGATSMTVSQLLTYASSQSNVGGSVWYGQVKKTQELAKDTFDAINNSQALVAP